MGVSIHHDVHYGTLNALLRNPGGGVARDMLRRGIRVQAQARRNLAGASGPRRIDTGLLRSSISVRPVMFAAGPGARIGTGAKTARWVHDGTGIYGPRHTPIKPRRGRYLVFMPKGAKGKVFARQVRGMAPNPFLKAALPAAKG